MAVSAKSSLSNNRNSSVFNFNSKNFIKRSLFVNLIFIIGLILAIVKVEAHVPVLNASYSYQNSGSTETLMPVLADLKLLRLLNIPALYKDEDLNVGVAWVNQEQVVTMSYWSHKVGRCANFEALNDSEIGANIIQSFNRLKELKLQNEKYQLLSMRSHNIQLDDKLQSAIDQVQPENLKSTVQYLSGFHNRYNKGSNPNQAIEAFKEKVIQAVTGTKLEWNLELISHRNTPQKSIRLRLTGQERPNEIVVIGGHIDSINGWGNKSAPAPGADDNASGSANVLEALRIVAQNSTLERSVEFFWYAGEESGLLGSAEIAEAYEREKKSVVAVLQLDMTAFPGNGPLVIGNVTDFTSAWLRDWLQEMNATYLKVTLVEDECGYGCSDHASWYRRGFPTLLPFEATTSTMNRNIHTADDVINNKINFEHSAVFSKIAVLFALDFGNSTKRQPF